MIKTFTVHTDANGYYHTTDTFQQPAPWGFHVDVFATIQAPDGLTVNGSVELDADSKTQSKSFIASTGQRISLGSWWISTDQNTIIIGGQSVPATPDTDVTIDVEADLKLF